MRREHEPSEKWSLETLGKYCRAKTDRIAADAWQTGKAMALAKKKTTHGQFSAWKRKWRYSDATVSRYIRLFAAYKSAESLRGKGTMEALRQADIVAPKPMPPAPLVVVPGKHMADRAKAVARRPEKSPPSTPAKYAWAVDEPSDFNLYDEVEDIEHEVEATSETVVRLEVERLPTAFATLKRQLDWIAGQEKKLLHRAWPREHTVDIKASAKEVQQALGKLMKLIPS